MSNLIEQRIEAARRGENPYVIAKLASGWLVIGDVQPLAGYCLLLADPMVESLNALGEAARIQYSLDMIAVGDALMAVTGAYRINYETLGNLEPALHTHIIPRFMSEPAYKRRGRAFFFWEQWIARRFDPVADGLFINQMRAWFRAAGLSST